MKISPVIVCHARGHRATTSPASHSFATAHWASVVMQRGRKSRVRVCAVGLAIAVLFPVGSAHGGEGDSRVGWFQRIPLSAGDEYQLDCKEQTQSAPAFTFAAFALVGNADREAQAKFFLTGVAQAGPGASAGHGRRSIRAWPRVEVDGATGAFGSLGVASSASMLYFGVAAWGADHTCHLSVNGNSVRLNPLLRGQARVLLPSEGTSGAGIEVSPGLSPAGHATRDVPTSIAAMDRGLRVDQSSGAFQFAVMDIDHGVLSATDPHGMRLESRGGLYIASEVAGVWNYRARGINDTWLKPWLWVMSLPQH